MPNLVVVIGGSCSGKSTWSRRNFHRLPASFYDVDALAKDLAGGRPPGRKHRNQAQKIVNKAIAGHVGALEDFGFESVYSGPRRPNDVLEAHKAGYRVAAVFLGTRHTDTNIRRVRDRVARGGHGVSESVIHKHWENSRGNLLSTWDALHGIEIYDSEEADLSLLAVKTGNEFTYRVPDGLLPGWMKFISDHAERHSIVRAYSPAAARGGRP